MRPLAFCLTTLLILPGFLVQAQDEPAPPPPPDAASDAEADGGNIGADEPDVYEYDPSYDGYSGIMGCCDDGIRLRGWLNGGFMGNTSSPGSGFNGPYNAVDQSNEGTLNQLYLVAEKDLPQCENGIGGRIDVLYGVDAFLAESIGMEKRSDGSAHWNDGEYGLAIPQAYVSFGRQDLSIQVGHFYSVVGYEGLMAPDNFFYSKSYSYQFAGPFTHWGGQATWKPSDAWTVQAGVHNGWDALDRVSDRPGFVGKIRYDDDSGAWMSFAITTGDEANDPAGLGLAADFSNRTRYSFLMSLPVTCQLEYVFHHWLGVQENGTPSGGRADWYGIDQYLYYTLNDCWKVGARFEWFHDQNGTRAGLNRPQNPNVAPFTGNFYSLSCGLNYSPCENLVIRPELRADWFSQDGTNRLPYSDGTDDTQFMLGVDAILSF
jgi:hypothetical protein